MRSRLTERPLCKLCGLRPTMTRGRLKDGNPKWSYRCDSCKKKPYRIHKGFKCERCGFVPEHVCQLDVDHINGKHKDNSLQNLMTLCANCHRLKTFQNEDWKVQV